MGMATASTCTTTIRHVRKKAREKGIGKVISIVLRYYGPENLGLCFGLEGRVPLYFAKSWLKGLARQADRIKGNYPIYYSGG